MLSLFSSRCLWPWTEISSISFGCVNWCCLVIIINLPLGLYRSVSGKTPKNEWVGLVRMNRADGRLRLLCQQEISYLLQCRFVCCYRSSTDFTYLCVWVNFRWKSRLIYIIVLFWVAIFRLLATTLINKRTSSNDFTYLYVWVNSIRKTRLIYIIVMFSVAIFGC